ncbi:hypothetical protein [Prosthecodimorpha staleyi]|uniref:Uncharacterized protein n=1 Tax=Prosthecodimorpha staleyi TaxID=2840188 RepID=A0A947D9M2_9HYPH|nr:hypothetical protein [Prosthecodimorpha staleyi]MBT9290862.1 hypothetical protein [Prosthecodimorpha staleyi]
MDHRQQEEARRRREAEAALKRVSRETETVGESAIGAAADRLKGHFAGSDAPAEDRVEVWGRRIGRGLAVVAFVVLLIHLVRTYVMS